jgi:integrase
VTKLQSTAALKRFRDMRFSLSLLLYSGVRPAEVERLAPEDVCWEERLVIIRPQKSKTGGGRVVPLRALPGLRQQDCRVPRNWQNRWLALRRAAGFTRWVPDVCRHTFATYHAAYFRNLPELQLEMGHRDVSLLRSRYMSPALRNLAEEFWLKVIKK